MAEQYMGPIAALKLAELNEKMQGPVQGTMFERVPLLQPYERTVGMHNANAPAGSQGVGGWKAFKPLPDSGATAPLPMVLPPKNRTEEDYTSGGGDGDGFSLDIPQFDYKFNKQKRKFEAVPYKSRRPRYRTLQEELGGTSLRGYGGLAAIAAAAQGAKSYNRGLNLAEKYAQKEAESGLDVEKARIDSDKLALAESLAPIEAYSKSMLGRSAAIEAALAEKAFTGTKAERDRIGEIKAMGQNSIEGIRERGKYQMLNNIIQAINEEPDPKKQMQLSKMAEYIKKYGMFSFQQLTPEKKSNLFGLGGEEATYGPAPPAIPRS